MTDGGHQTRKGQADEPLGPQGHTLPPNTHGRGVAGYGLASSGTSEPEDTRQGTTGQGTRAVAGE